MTNYPTLLGHEPRFTGLVRLVRGSLPFIPPRILSEACDLHPRITIKDERVYRFPLIVRQESIKRGGRRPGSDRFYRWMLYAIPYDSKLDQIETELKALNSLRKARDERHFPLLASDISSHRWNYPYLGGKDITMAPVFVPAFRRLVS